MSKPNDENVAVGCGILLFLGAGIFLYGRITSCILMLLGVTILPPIIWRFVSQGFNDPWVRNLAFWGILAIWLSLVCLL